MLGAQRPELGDRHLLRSASTSSKSASSSGSARSTSSTSKTAGVSRLSQRLQERPRDQGSAARRKRRRPQRRGPAGFLASRRSRRRSPSRPRREAAACRASASRSPTRRGSSLRRAPRSIANAREGDRAPRPSARDRSVFPYTCGPFEEAGAAPKAQCAGHATSARASVREVAGAGEARLELTRPSLSRRRREHDELMPASRCSSAEDANPPGPKARGRRPRRRDACAEETVRR